MKKTLLALLFCFAAVSAGHAQKVAVKVNGLGLATFAGFGKWSPTPNVGVEVALWPKWTLDLDGYVNPFKYGRNKSTQFWAVQPELRYWLCSKFNGHFFGLHGQYADYQGFGKSAGFGMKRYIYDGWFAGVGVSYGYVLPLAHRWKLEFNLGFGWNAVRNSEIWFRESQLGHPIGDYGPQHGMELADHVRKNKNYWGITRAGINLIFIIR